MRSLTQVATFLAAAVKLGKCTRAARHFILRLHRIQAWLRLLFWRRNFTQRAHTRAWLKLLRERHGELKRIVSSALTVELNG